MLNHRKDYEKIYSLLINFIKKQAAKNPVVIGISGGIDSALCGYLAYKALGKNKVITMLMPSEYTLKSDFKDAKKYAKKISKKVVIVDDKKILKIRKDYDKVIKTGGKSEDIIMDAYVRSNILRRYSRLNECIVIGTINGTEWRTGYYPKYILIGDLLPIANLYKSQVFELAEYLKLPKEIIGKKPTLSLGCSPKVKDEKLGYIDKELIKSGLHYNQLDKILKGLDKKFTDKKILKYSNKEISLKQIKIVRTLVEKYRHKTKLPPFPKIN